MSEVDVSAERDLSRPPGRAEDTLKENQENRTLMMVAMILLDLNKCNPHAASPAESICLAGSDAGALEKKVERAAGCRSNAGDSRGSAAPKRSRSKKAAPRGEFPEKRHCCPFAGCGKMYGKSSHLKAHLRVHTGKRGGGSASLHCHRSPFHFVGVVGSSLFAIHSVASLQEQKSKTGGGGSALVEGARECDPGTPRVAAHNCDAP